MRRDRVRGCVVVMGGNSWSGVVVVTIQQVCISSLEGERRRTTRESGPVEDAFAAGGEEGLGQEEEGNRRREFVG